MNSSTNVVSSIRLNQGVIDDVLLNRSGVTFNKDLQIIVNPGTYGTAIYGIKSNIKRIELKTVEVFVKERLDFLTRSNFPSVCKNSDKVVYGLWVDKSGITYLDVGLTVRDRREAWLLGISTGQKYVGYTGVTGIFTEIKCWGDEPSYASRFEIDGPVNGELLIQKYLEMYDSENTEHA